MADEEQLKILKQGVKVWNAWRQKNPGVVVDLTKANLSGVRLSRANFNGANLSRADLKRANLFGTDFIGANLTHADLSLANLTKANLALAKLTANLDAADLSNANLRYADLSNASLSRTYLYAADLTGANLSGAYFIHTNFSFANLVNTNFASAHMSNAIFAHVDFSTALNLETAEHIGPSTIGIDTMYNSIGKIPESFLRDCGVPDSFITQVKALIGAEEGMQFYSCFISYSGVDEEFARRLHGRLQQAHVRVWFAPEDIHSGQKLHEQIDEAIRVFDKLLIVLSPNSLKSEWVKTELRKARKRERQHGKRKLFPLRLVDYETLRDWECFDADHGQDLATEVREYFIPDFTNWKDHDAFEAAFARLLEDLRATDLKAVE